MPTVSDILAIEIGLDTSGLISGRQQAEEAVEGTRRSLQQGGDDIERLAKSIVANVETALRSLASLFGIVLTFEGFKRMVIQAVEAGTSLGRFAESIDSTAEKVGELEQVWERALGPGKGASIRGVLARMKSDIQGVRMGTMAPPEWMNMLGRLGVGNLQYREPDEILMDAARRMQGMQPTLAEKYLPGVGVTPEDMLLLTKPGELQRHLDAVRGAGTRPTTPQVQAAERLTAQFASLEQLNMQVLRDFVVLTEPFLRSVLEFTSDLLRWVNRVEKWLSGEPATQPELGRWLRNREGTLGGTRLGETSSGGMVGSRGGFGGFRPRISGGSGENRAGEGGGGGVGAGGLSSGMTAVRGSAEAALRARGVPFNVTSGYRSPEHNARVGGASGSQHLHGNAIDVSLRGMTPEQKQAVVDQLLGDPRVGGFGYYPNSDSIHVDVRGGGRAAWGSNYHSSSVGSGWPQWMTDRVKRWQSAPGPAAAVGSPIGGSQDVVGAIREASKTSGIPESLLGGMASIESSMNPASNLNRSTQYKGLFQLGTEEWARWGSGNIYDARDNALAAGRMLRHHIEQFKGTFGRDPTGIEIYMMHQQGLGFYTRGAMTNIGGNPYPGMSGPQTHESFEAGWAAELARRVERYQRGHPESVLPSQSGIPSPQSLIRIPDVATGAAAAVQSAVPPVVNNKESMTTVQQVIVNTHATDAAGIAEDVKTEIGRQLSPPQQPENAGVQGVDEYVQYLRNKYLK